MKKQQVKNLLNHDLTKQIFIPIAEQGAKPIATNLLVKGAKPLIERGYLTEKQANMFAKGLVKFAMALLKNQFNKGAYHGKATTGRR